MKNDPIEPFYYLFYVTIGVALGYFLFSTGFVYGFNNAYYGVSKPDVKNRIIKEGNILKYPFGTNGREAAQTSDSNCVRESGIVKEEASEKEGA